MSDERPGMLNMVVQGAQAPAMFTFALALNFIALGAVLLAMGWLRSDSAKLYTELRILQVHVQDQNAILIREGLKKPNDEHAGPTSGER